MLERDNKPYQRKDNRHLADQLGPDVRRVVHVKTEHCPQYLGQGDKSDRRRQEDHCDACRILPPARTERVLGDEDQCDDHNGKVN